MKNFRIKKEDTVLLIIDIQERLLPVMKDKDRVIEFNNILIQAAREMNIPIIVTEQYPRGLGHTCEELKNLEGAKTFEKTKFSALTSEVEDYLESLGKKQVIVTGIESHVCVYQTCRELKAKGYDVFLPIEGVSSRKDLNMDNALDQISQSGGLVSNVETLLFDLLGDAKSEHFKAISKLIK